MNEPSIDPALPLPRVGNLRRCRIAIGLQDEGERDTFVTLLGAAGLPVNAGAVAIRRIDELLVDPPDALVLVADLRRPQGLTALRRVHRLAPETRIVVVAADDDPTSLQARQALNAGADAFVARSAAGRSLTPAVHAVIAGLVCAPRAERRLLAKPIFSHREKEVLSLVVAGLTNREIAGRLFLAESTVKSHLMSAFAKLGVRSRKYAVALLLDPAEGLATTALPPDATFQGRASGSVHGRPGGFTAVDEPTGIA